MTELQLEINKQRWVIIKPGTTVPIYYAKNVDKAKRGIYVGCGTVTDITSFSVLVVGIQGDMDAVFENRNEPYPERLLSMEFHHERTNHYWIQL